MNASAISTKPRSVLLDRARILLFSPSFSWGIGRSSGRKGADTGEADGKAKGGGILGATYDIKTLDGDIKLKIPNGVSFGEVLRIKGKGVLFEKNKRGDILIRVKIEIPKKLSKEAQKATEILKKEGK